MITETLEETKYNSKILNEVVQVQLKPSDNDYYTFIREFSPGKDFRLFHTDLLTSIYYHASGAVVKMHFEKTISGDVGDLDIIGTNEAVKDAWSSLELRTERRLEEVSQTAD